MILQNMTYFDKKEKEEDMVRARGTDKAEVIRVIKTTSLIGIGTEKDPVRYIYQYCFSGAAGFSEICPAAF